VQVTRRPAFVDDLTEAYAFLAHRSPTAADRLLDQVEAAVELLSHYPDLGHPREDLRPGLRSLRVRPFQHLLFYRRAADEIVLLRLIHGARDLPAQPF
jgi:toxin ParE1/3/4